MSTRTERRAAEHQARKLAHKQSRQQSVVVAAAEHDNSDISEAQLTANRENAKRSTGPTTTIGKAVSARNALTYGLTGQTVLLPTDDTDEYHRRHQTALDTFLPATEEEQRLVQSITDAYWRLNRIQRIETGILMKGHIEFANKYEDHPEHRRFQLIETDTYLKYEKSIRNLHIQEARLHRRIEKDQAELTRLQAIRKRDERLAAEQMKASAPVIQNGFEFSTSYFDPQHQASNEPEQVIPSSLPAHFEASV